MGSSIVIVTFDNETIAYRALESLQKMRGEKMFEMSDAVVVTKDIHGQITVKETEELTPKRGAVTGGVAGLVPFPRNP